MNPRDDLDVVAPADRTAMCSDGTTASFNASDTVKLHVVDFDLDADSDNDDGFAQNAATFATMMEDYLEWRHRVWGEELVGKLTTPNDGDLDFNGGGDTFPDWACLQQAEK